MKLLWKLLRQHISAPQIMGFLFANFFGMAIMLAACQFYIDTLPLFTGEDSFLKADYLIINKRTALAASATSGEDTFSDIEIKELNDQPFVKHSAPFTSASYKINAKIGIGGRQMVSTEFYFESVPDRFVDADSTVWRYSQSDGVIPIILPRAYLTMYNFGFSKQHSTQKISEGLAGMIDIAIFVHGNEKEQRFTGKVIGFSNRMNTILVPQSFMDWSNEKFGDGGQILHNRLIAEVGNPSDSAITKYIEKKGYDVDSDKLEVEKTAYFLRILVTVVLTVGLLITLLSVYLLMLSIYLLVEKNAEKLRNLMLIGYGRLHIATPYILLTVALNATVLVASLLFMLAVRSNYIDFLLTLFPDMPDASISSSVALGMAAFIVVTIFNTLVITNKVANIKNT